MMLILGYAKVLVKHPVGIYYVLLKVISIFTGTRSSIYVLQGEINTTVYRWDCLWCYRSRHGVQLNESVRQSVLYKLTIKYLSIYNLYIDG